MSDFLDISANQNENAAQTETEELQEGSGGIESDFESVCVELVSGNGEKIAFSQKVERENSEESGYKVVLRPGEEWKIRFIAEMNDLRAEKSQKGDSILKVIGVWDKEETAAEG